MAWDGGSPKQQASVQARALKVQLVDAVGPFSPFWRDRFNALVAALPLLPTASLQALQLAALGAGSPALFPGDDPDEVAQALRLVPATVLALPSASACVRSAPRWSAAATLPTDGVVMGTSQRRSTVGVLVHVVPRSDVDPSDVAVGVALDVRVAAGPLPTQVVVDDAESLPDEDRLSRRLHRRL